MTTRALPSRERRLLRFRHGRPPLGRGLRAGCSLIVPLFAFYLAGQTSLGTFAAVGALFVTLVDTGGTYASKARTMAATIGLCMLAMGLGTLAGTSFWFAVTGLGLWAFAMAFSVLFSSNAVMVGYVATVAFAAGAGISTDAHVLEAALRPLAILSGGLWTMLLALALWPIFPYKAACAAVGNAYRAVGNLFRAVPQFTDPGSALWETAAEEQREVARRALQEAAAALRSVHLSRHGAGNVSRRLVALYTDAEALFKAATVLAEALDASVESGAADHDELLACVVELGAALDGVGTAIAAGGRKVDASAAAGRVAAFVAATRPDSVLVGMLCRIGRIVSLSAGMAGHVRDPRPIPADTPGDRPLFRLERRTDHVELIRANLSLDSAAFRHAVRLGCTTAAAVVVYTIFGLPKPFWVTLAVIAVVKPDLGGTIDTAWRSAVGTLLGCSVVAVAILFLRSEPAVILAVFAFAFAMVTLAFYNAAFSAATVAPIFVLLADITDIGDWKLALLRVFNTLVGVVIGLVGGYLLWPATGRTTWWNELARLMRGLRDYMAGVLSGYVEPGSFDPEAVFATHRRLARIVVNSGAMTQQLLAQPEGLRGPAAVSIDVSAQCFRLLDATAVLEQNELAHPPGGGTPVTGGLVGDLTDDLSRLADAAESRRPATGVTDLDGRLNELQASHPDFDRSVGLELARAAQAISNIDGALRDAFCAGAGTA